MALVAAIRGADDWGQVVVLPESMLDWLGQYVADSSGVPCESTCIDLFKVVGPLEMVGALRELASLVREKFPRETVCFDGQTARGTVDAAKGVKGIHLLHAWGARKWPLPRAAQGRR